MPTKPTVKPEWATTDVIDGTSGENNVAEPTAARKASGWNFEEKPTRQWWNWLQRIIYTWIDWLDGTTIPLTNSGTTTNEQLPDGTGHTHEIETGAGAAQIPTNGDLVPVTVAGFLSATKIYVSTSSELETYDVDSQVTEYTWSSIGPTGSGADHIWTGLDSMLSEAVFVDLYVDVWASGSDAEAGIYFSRTGDNPTQRDDAVKARIDLQITDNVARVRTTGTVRVLLDASNRFDIWWNLEDGGDIDLKMAGFGM